MNAVASSFTVRRDPVTSFFVVGFLISWGGGLALRLQALALFPILILSVAAAGLVLTRIVDGRAGLRRIWIEEKTWRIGRWYGLVLAPPVLILLTLSALRVVAGPSFTPNFLSFTLRKGIRMSSRNDNGRIGRAAPMSGMRARFTHATFTFWACVSRCRRSTLSALA